MPDELCRKFIFTAKNAERQQRTEKKSMVINLLFHHSIIPSFHYSITPLLRYSIIPLFHYSTPPASIHTSYLPNTSNTVT